MNCTFNFYEYGGVIVPGAVFTLGIVWLVPESSALFGKEAVTLGGLGLFVIVAYAAGQLIQGVGNWIEWLWWKAWGGFPGRQVLAGKLLSAEQHSQVMEALQNEGMLIGEVSMCSTTSWMAIAREVYAAVASAGKAARIDTFNGNYGLLRGLAAAFLALVAVAAVLGKGVYVVLGLVILLLLALQRMHRFGKHYALELFIQTCWSFVSRTRQRTEFPGFVWSVFRFR